MRTTFNNSRSPIEYERSVCICVSRMSVFQVALKMLPREHFLVVLPSFKLSMFCLLLQAVGCFEMKTWQRKFKLLGFHEFFFTLTGKLQSLNWHSSRLV